MRRTGGRRCRRGKVGKAHVVSSAAPQTQDAPEQVGVYACRTRRNSASSGIAARSATGCESSTARPHTCQQCFLLWRTVVYGRARLAGAAGLAVGGFAYASVWPTSQIFGRTLIAPRRPGELALTFDDGPNPAWTPRLLDILAEHDVHATFFMRRQIRAVRTGAGAADRRRRPPDRQSLLEPSQPCPHSLRPGSRANCSRPSDTLEQITGKPVRFFRPPFGARRPAVLRTARELGLTPVMWNAMTDDWSEPSADRIAPT